MESVLLDQVVEYQLELFHGTKSISHCEPKLHAWAV